MTTVAAAQPSEADWAAASDVFNADELAFLTLAIGGINLWNRT